MMTTESYYHSADFESAYRSPHRPMPAATYYSRVGPYGYYDHGRYHTRQHYDDRQVQDSEVNSQWDQSARRRIAVACVRCRKRKIKCTGDPGDGSGCSACKSVGPSLGQECTFHRVGSGPVAIANLEMLATQPVYHGIPTPPIMDTRDRRPSERHHRSRRGIPVLHTRSAFPTELDSAASWSPVEGYTYVPTTTSRQDSMGSIYGTGGFRSWSVTSSAALPTTTSNCDPQMAYNFGPMQYQPHELGRLPSVSSESLSALNMGHLNSSLPSQTAQNRRLPAPYVSQYADSPIPQPETALVRPLGSFSTPRIPANGIQTRNALPWAIDTGAPRVGSISSYIPNNLPSVSTHSTSTLSETAMGYHFAPTTQATGYGSSPELSPTAPPPSLATSFESTSSSSGSDSTIRPYAMPTMQYCPTTSSQQEVSSVTSSNRPSSLRQRSVQDIPSLYSFGTTSSDVQSTSPDGLPSSDVTTYSLPVRASTSESSPYVDATDAGYQTTIQHPRPMPQHSTSVEHLCRQPSFEHQTPRSSAASRMSISNFSSNYQ